MNPWFANIVVNVFLKGGPVMWPILLCMIAALAVMLERAFWWWNLKRRSQPGELNQAFDAISNGDFLRAARLAEQSNDPCLLAVHEGLLHEHSSSSRRDITATTSKPLPAAGPRKRMGTRPSPLPKPRPYADPGVHMPVKLTSRPAAENEARIEIIPLIDIMFFLLASFMLVSLS